MSLTILQIIVAIALFNVTVKDEEDPRISVCPTAPVVANTANNSCVANVSFTVDATDNCNVKSIVSVPASGSAVSTR